MNLETRSLNPRPRDRVSKYKIMKNQHAEKHASLLVLKRPRITEKATMLAERNDMKAYTFEIDARANKPEVVAAVKKLFGVTPRKVAITNNPRKAVIVRGKAGFKGGVKKAVVYLKKGDKIETS